MGRREGARAEARRRSPREEPPPACRPHEPRAAPRHPPLFILVRAFRRHLLAGPSAPPPAVPTSAVL